MQPPTRADLMRGVLRVLFAANIAALIWLVWTPADLHTCDAATSLIGRAFCLAPWLTWVGNVMLLVPTAVLLRLLYPTIQTKWLVVAMTSLACLIELVQFAIPGRDPNILDVIANAGGAAVVCLLMAGRRT